jgi:energy-converting hydrogenase Eha subunit C
MHYKVTLSSCTLLTTQPLTRLLRLALCHSVALFRIVLLVHSSYSDIAVDVLSVCDCSACSVVLAPAYLLLTVTVTLANSTFVCTQMEATVV